MTAMRIEHLPYEGTGVGQRRVESYLLHFRGYYGNTHMQFRSLEQMESFADNLKKAVRKYRRHEMRGLPDAAQAAGGMQWTESCDDLPLCDCEFDRDIFTSIPCEAVTDEGRAITAVYVYAVSVVPNNDGTRPVWEGWAEKTGDADDFSCVWEVLQGKTVNVIRWRYPNGTQKPTQKSYEKMLEMEKHMASAAEFVDSHPLEWPLVMEDGTLNTKVRAIIGKYTEE